MVLYNKAWIKALVLLGACFFCSMNSFSQQYGGERLSLDKGWRFYLGDIPFPVITGHDMSYSSAKAGKAWGAAAPDFDDTNWRLLNLPHDWAVEQPYDATANLSQGYKQRGIGWYRRNFKLDSADHGKYIELQFDGIATFCTIWVNGIIVHRNWCGYTSSYIDVTPFVKFGDEVNSIAIRVDAVAQEGWWYEGAGIYRHTWLVKRSPVHIITDGVYAQPIKTKGSWVLPVEATVANSGKKNVPYEVDVSLLDPDGMLVASGKTTANVNALEQSVSSLSLHIDDPKLWTLDNPTLYKVHTVIKQNGVISDSLITSCGFRTIRFTADSGFYLNDKRIKIKGVCNHQDHAGVGVAVPNSIWDFRLRRLKEMGVNACRCSHNPPAAEFLEACDRIGMLVMDENRNFNSSPEFMRQLEWMIRRDRNHPGIILWSVFNEEPMAGTENGYEMVRRMRSEVEKLDTTRYVTAAASSGLFAPVNVSQAVDVVGFNYQPDNYDRFHKENPQMLITSSEDGCGLMTRSEYKTDLKKHLFGSYDTNFADWGLTQRADWKAIDERPFVAGCFIWTGFDYRGEPQPFSWPTASSSFGILDLCGFAKAAFYIHQAQWIDDRPVLQLIPHWNWPPDSIGKNIKVMAMSNADSVQLILNGKEIGEQAVDKYAMNTWEVPYQPGKLEAIGYKDKKKVSEFIVETTGEPVKVELIPDRKSIMGDGWDAMPVTVRVLDVRGRPVETANLNVEFEVSGAGSIIGLGNGDANSHEPEQGNERSLYNGLAQVILQGKEGGSGQLTLTARCKGLIPGKVSINVIPAAPKPFVAVIDPELLLEKWKVSPITVNRPDPNQQLNDLDQNSWSPVKPGVLLKFAGGNYAVYHTYFKPYKGQQENGGKLMLKNVTGKAEVYLDKKLVYKKVTSGKGDLLINIPAGNGGHELSVLIETEKGLNAGLGGLVTLTQ